MNDLERVVQHDINKIISELKRCTSMNIYSDLVAKLYYLNELIVLKKLNIEYPKEYWFEYFKNDTNNKKTDFYKEVNYNININYDYNLKLAKMSDKLSNRYVDEGNSISLRYTPFKKSFELVSSFLKTFDNDIYKYYLELINSPRFVLLDQVDNYEGWALRNNYLVDSYTIIIPNFFITDYLAILHETMHSYNFKLIKNCSIKEQDNITINGLFEAPSFFIEHVALDYLDKIGYDKKEIYKLRGLFDKELIFLLETYKNMLLDGFDEYSDYLYNETYSFGRVLSYHFYDNYLKDPNGTLNNLKKFMVDYKTYDKYYLLNNYGLNSNDIINSQKLTRHMDKHLMRL